jgi:hypothetical protein
VTNPEERVDLLLKKVDGYERVRVRSAVWEDMPERMLPLTVEGEQVILGTLTEELRRNFGVKVSGRLEMKREGKGRRSPCTGTRSWGPAMRTGLVMYWRE